MSDKNCIFLRETSVLRHNRVYVEQSRLFDGEVAVQTGLAVAIFRDGQKVNAWDNAALIGTDMAYADARIAMRGIQKLIDHMPHIGRALRVRRLKAEWELQVVDEITSS